MRRFEPGSPVISLVLVRVAVFALGVLAAAVFGTHVANEAAFDPGGAGSALGDAGDAVLGPWARWDSVWFLEIATSGYGPADGGTPAFFPLYPLLAGTLGIGAAGPSLVAAFAVSAAALAVAFWFIHRLVALEAGERVAWLTLLLIACFPSSVFLGAIYSESLFLALSAGSMWFARTGRWPLAGLLGMGAVLTRSAGLALVLPLLVWWREQRREGAAAAADSAWVALVPAGVALFAGLLLVGPGDAFAFIAAQDRWARELSPFGPFGGIAEGAAAAVRSLGDVIRGDEPLVAWSLHGGAVQLATQNLELALVTVFGLVALAGTFRRLPLAHGAYAAAALALPLSYPREDVPLFSMSRFVVVVFPLFVWLALVLAPRPRARRAWLAISVLGLAWYTARFATWQWVA